GDARAGPLSQLTLRACAVLEHPGNHDVWRDVHDAGRLRSQRLAGSDCIRIRRIRDHVSQLANAVVSQEVLDRTWTGAVVEHTRACANDSAPICRRGKGYRPAR